MTQVYVTNQLGDVVQQTDERGIEVAVDPSSWGWLKAGGANDPGELRRPVGSLVWMPGFTVAEQKAAAFVPGPRSRGQWQKWAPRAAPPAAVESAGGTRAYFDRLSEAAGVVGVLAFGERTSESAKAPATQGRSREAPHAAAERAILAA